MALCGLSSCAKLFGRIPDSGVTQVKFHGGGAASRTTPRNEAQAGGMVVWGVADAAGVAPISFTLQNDTTAKTLTLPNGAWSFYAIGWAGTGNMQGHVRCGKNNQTLNGADATVTIGIAQDCLTALDGFFGPAAYQLTTSSPVTIEPQPLTFVTCSDLTGLSSGSTNCNSNAGDLHSFRVRLGAFDPGAALAAPAAPNEFLDSACLQLSTGSSMGSSFEVPVGSGAAVSPLYTVIRGYTSFDCGAANSDSPIEYTFPHGLLGPGVTGNSFLNSASNQTYVFLEHTHPTISGVSPPTLPTSVATAVHLTGQHFAAGASVTIEGSACGGVSVGGGGTTIDCFAPAGLAVGTAVPVAVHNPDGTSTLTNGVINVSADTPPVLGAVDPQVGPSAFNTNITLSGSGFASGTFLAVWIGSTPCNGASVVGATVTCTVPSGIAAGAYDVVLYNGDGEMARLASGYAVSNDSPPTVSSVGPSAVPTSVASPIHVSGTNFAAGVQVTIGGTACSSATLTGTTGIDCVAPAGLTVGTNVPVEVRNPDGLTSQPVGTINVSADAPPSISVVSPGAGPSNDVTSILVSGANFVDGSPRLSVFIGSTPCTSVSLLDGSDVTCTVPSGMTVGTYDVLVVNTDGMAASLHNGYVVSADSRPTVSAIVPSAISNTAATSITILGSNFAAGAIVTIGGSANCTSVTLESPTELTCMVPAGVNPGSSVPVSVQNADGLVTQPPGSLHVSSNPAPTITQAGGVTPAVALAGSLTNLTITGTGFLANPTVLVGPDTCTVNSVSSTSIQCSFTGSDIGSLDVTVTNSDGLSATDAGGFHGGGWIPMAAPPLGTDDPYTGAVALNVGGELLLFGGKASDGTSFSNRTPVLFDPLDNSWSTGMPAPSSVGSYYPSAVSTGSGMILFGGEDLSSTDVNTGATYDDVNGWTAINTANAPSARENAATVWTGSEMIVWGGLHSVSGTNTALGDGARYNPGNDTWTTMSTTNAPSARYGATAVWTGSEMIVWGGVSADNTTFLNDGARYNPSNDTWTPIAAAPTAPGPGLVARAQHSAVWTGSSMIVFGGKQSAGNALSTGAIYSPSGDSWVMLPAAPAPRANGVMYWDGSRILYWGGTDFGSTLPTSDVGMIYDSGLGTWGEMISSNGPADHNPAWGTQIGSRFIVWGGQSQNGGSQVDDPTGGMFDN